MTCWTHYFCALSLMHRNWSEALTGLANPELVMSNFTVSTFLFCFEQKSFASRYTSAFAPSAGPKPTCRLLFASIYVSLSMGTTPVFEQQVKTIARVASHVFIISPLGVQRLNMLAGAVKLQIRRDSCACSATCQRSPRPPFTHAIQTGIVC